MNARIGDKVRLKIAKKRGVVESLNGDCITIRVEGEGVVVVDVSAITNYSLAARKAWQNMPSRCVGRPVGTTKTDRVSVTLRIDRELWEKFKVAETSGQIGDRTSTINQWIDCKLDELVSHIVKPLERN